MSDMFASKSMQRLKEAVTRSGKILVTMREGFSDGIVLKRDEQPSSKRKVERDILVEWDSQDMAYQQIHVSHSLKLLNLTIDIIEAEVALAKKTGEKPAGMENDQKAYENIGSSLEELIEHYKSTSNENMRSMAFELQNDFSTIAVRYHELMGSAEPDTRYDRRGIPAIKMALILLKEKFGKAAEKDIAHDVGKMADQLKRVQYLNIATDKGFIKEGNPLLPETFISAQRLYTSCAMRHAALGVFKQSLAPPLRQLPSILPLTQFPS